jgi:hypothetical protein
VLTRCGGVRHPLMMRKNHERRQIATLLGGVRSSRPRLRSHRVRFRRELPVVRLLMDQPRVDRQGALEVPLFGQDASHRQGGERFVEETGTASENARRGARGRAGVRSLDLRWCGGQCGG